MAVAPTIRNDGSALVAGDIYFDTVKQATMQRTTTGWVKTLLLNDIVDALNSTAADKALSAKQGKTLSDVIGNMYSKPEVDTLVQSSSMPIGMTFPWTLSEASIPGGTIPRNGQLLSRAVWPQLWALVSTQAVSDATWLAAPYTSRGMYSTGDGSTTFRMPDDNAKHADGNTIAAVTYRGYGKNSAGTPGTHQADQMQKTAIKGAYFNSSSAISGNSYTSSTDVNPGGGAGQVQVTINAITSDGTNGTPRLGSETRMTNSTVIWVTVGANSTTNTGAVDVTALASQVSLQAGKIATLETGFKIEIEVLWTGSIGSAGPVTLTRDLQPGDMLFLQHNDGQAEVTYLTPLKTTASGRFVRFLAGTAIPTVTSIGATPNIINFSTFTAGYGVSSINNYRVVKK